MSFKIATGSRTGEKHSENEDHFSVRELLDLDANVLTVCDGIGSHPFGGSVAKWVANYIKTAPLRLSGEHAVAMKKFLDAMQLLFTEEFEDFPEFAQSGCTVSTALVTEDQVYCFWVGDSPIYHVCSLEKKVIRLTEPHAHHSVLSRCFKGSKKAEFDYVQAELRRGDLVVLVSDGVSLNDGLLQDVLEGELTQAFVDDILANSVQPVGSDDATMICYKH